MGLSVSLCVDLSARRQDEVYWDPDDATAYDAQQETFGEDENYDYSEDYEGYDQCGYYGDYDEYGPVDYGEDEMEAFSEYDCGAW